MTDENYSRALILLSSWLLPVALLAHLAEEYWGGGGFSAYVAKTRGAQLSPTRFLFLTGLGWALTVLGIWLAHRYRFPQMLLVILSTVLLVNGLSHTITGARTLSYNPGLVSGLLIFIPFGALLLLSLRSEMTGRRYAVAVLIGLGIHAVISLLARGGRP